jgi:hypothetical protein
MSINANANAPLALSLAAACRIWEEEEEVVQLAQKQREVCHRKYVTLRPLILP